MWTTARTLPEELLDHIPHQAIALQEAQRNIDMRYRSPREGPPPESNLYPFSLVCQRWYFICRASKSIQARLSSETSSRDFLVATKFDRKLTSAVRHLAIKESQWIAPNTSKPSAWSHLGLTSGLPQMLTSLSSMQWSTSNHAPFDAMMPPRLSQALPALLSPFQNVTVLSLLHHSFRTYTRLARFVFAFLRLETLFCLSLRIADQPEHPKESLYGGGKALKRIHFATGTDRHLGHYLWLFILAKCHKRAGNRTTRAFLHDPDIISTTELVVFLGMMCLFPTEGVFGGLILGSTEASDGCM